MAKKKRAAGAAKAKPLKTKAAPAVGNTRRVLNCTPSRETERDWTFENAAIAGVAAAGPIPVSKDLREPLWWTIGDQGQTGSCVGWATADSVLRWHFVKANRLDKNKPLSTRFTWMASKEFDEFTTAPTTFIEIAGTSLKSALDVSRKYGAVLDDLLPFKSSALYQGKENDFYATAARLKIASYISLRRDLMVWRSWIANNGPILTRLDVDSTWYQAKQNAGKLDVYDVASADGGHAVALVGYTPTSFIVRNSWGTQEWGDKGFGYASNAYASAAFTEAYGVTV